MNLLIILGIIIIFAYLLFSKNVKIKEPELLFNRRVLPYFINTLLFISIIGFFSWYLFKIETFFWLGVLSIFIMSTFFKIFRSRKMWFIIFAVLYIVRVPINASATIDYINNSDNYLCINSLECVRVIQPENNKESYSSVEYAHIQENKYNWYVLFSKGEVTLNYTTEEIETLRFLNIGGFWIGY